MGAGFYIFSLYNYRQTGVYFLLRTFQPTYSNSNQAEENLAIQTEINSRNALLLKVAGEHTAQVKLSDFTYIGEMQGFPPGDILYEKQGCKALSLYYCETSFGAPWIVLGIAESETEFVNELQADGDLTSFFPLGEVKKITTGFYVQPD
jgi:hypothetical protein